MVKNICFSKCSLKNVSLYAILSQLWTIETRYEVYIVSHMICTKAKMVKINQND